MCWIFIVASIFTLLESIVFLFDTRVHLPIGLRDRFALKIRKTGAQSKKCKNRIQKSQLDYFKVIPIAIDTIFIVASIIVMIVDFSLSLQITNAIGKTNIIIVAVCIVFLTIAYDVVITIWWGIYGSKHKSDEEESIQKLQHIQKHDK